MLQFSVNLLAALARLNTTQYWYIKLYYNDETNFIALSDKPRTIDGVFYRGLVMQWGGPTQRVSLNAFSASLRVMRMTIDNAQNQIEGGRFTDLFTTKNFFGRKWELYLATQETPNVADHALIGSGTVAGKPNQKGEKVALQLNDWMTGRTKIIPTARVTKDDYPQAPTENIEKPVPIAYGDNAAIADNIYARFGTAIKHPAIIVEKQDPDGFARALPDTDLNSSVILHALDDKGFYAYSDTQYLLLEDTSNIDMVAAPSVAADNNVGFKGNLFSLLVPLVSDIYGISYGGGSGTTNSPGSVTDNDIGTFARFIAPNANPFPSGFVFKALLPKIPIFGDTAAIDNYAMAVRHFWPLFDIPPAGLSNFYQIGGVDGNFAGSGTGGYELVDFVTGMLTSAQITSQDLENIEVRYECFWGSSAASRDVYDMSILVRYRFKDTYSRQYKTQVSEVRNIFARSRR